MDGIKLEKWRRAFDNEVTLLQAEYDALFLPKKFEDTYVLQVDETKHTLCLKMDGDLPAGMQNRLEKLLLATEPEDSV